MTFDPARPKHEPNPVAKMFGAMLMAVGGLIATLCGLCSLAFIGLNFTSAITQSGWSGVGSAVLIALATGAIPVSLGVLIFIAGRNLYRRN